MTTHDTPTAEASASSALTPKFFNFDAQAVRVVGSSEQPWFVAKDVCDVLGLLDTTSLRGLAEDEKGKDTIRTLGGPQEFLTVNESGLYCLIFRSRKAEAQRFRKWVTSEVLPAIRRTGAYAVRPEPRAIDQPAYRQPRSLVAPSAGEIDHVAKLLSLTLGDDERWTGSRGELLSVALHFGLFSWILAEIDDDDEQTAQVRFALTLGRFANQAHVLSGGRLAMFLNPRSRRFRKGPDTFTIFLL